MRSLLRPVSRTLRRARAHARGFAAWRGSRAGGAEPRLAYGQPIPAPSDRAHGGIIKLQHLQRAFVHDERGFNVLYLVSSRLPDGAVALAKWARRAHAAVVLNQNGVAYPAWYGAGWERANGEIRGLLSMADYVFYQSNFCRISADRFAGPARSRFEILHNPVDTDAFTAREPAVNGPLILLLAGSQDQWYRVESALRATARLLRGGIDVRLLITGRLGWRPDDAGRARHEAETLIEQLQLTDRVEFLGRYTQREAPAIFRRAHVLLHTKYNDPCPTVVLEGLASGLPVVYSASGGVPELVGDEAGVGIAAELDWSRDHAPDPEALARGIEQVWGAWSRFSAAARARAVARFDVRRWIEQHRQVLAGLLASAGTRDD
jgi:glycosyltransferase involved in cell wall biosynthesis